MNTKRATKRALLTSVMALVMCVVMLVGTTFAWFTDTASTGVNKIQAGKLDVALVDEAGNSLEGKTLTWVAYDGRAQNEILWEPGCTYNTQPFYIKNEGNLNLKFKVMVSGINGDAELAEVISFSAMAEADQFHFNTGAISITVDDDGKFDLLKGYTVDTLFYDEQTFTEYTLEPGNSVGPLVISGHMDENAGNAYQGLSIDGIAITILATQGTGDEDSYNGTYDEKAEYPVEVKDASALSTALEAGKDVVLTQDLTLSESITIPANANATLETNGNTLTCTSQYGAFDLKDGANLTVAGGGEIKASLSNAQRVFNVSDKNSTLTISDVNVTTDNGFVAVEAGTVIIEGGTYNITNGGAAVFAYGEDSKVIINGGTFTGTDGGEGAVYAFNGATVEVTGGTFNFVDEGDVNWTLCDYSQMTSYPFTYGGVSVTTAGKISVTGGTFNKDVSELPNYKYDGQFSVVYINYVANGYEAVNNNNGTWTVKAKT